MKYGLAILLALALLAPSSIGSASGPTTQTQTFDLEQLLIDVFAPQPGEKVLLMTDLPHDEFKNNIAWAERRTMVREWHEVFQRLQESLGITVHPPLTFPATGAHNAPLPQEGHMQGQPVRVADILADTDIAIALTEYSATAPLILFTQQFPHLRAASMPGISPSTEQTALNADYVEVARRSHVLAERLDRAVGAVVDFSTGNQLYFDLRGRHAKADDGHLPANKQGARVINLPSGEAYIAPYEGDLEGQPSQTEGSIPYLCGEDIVSLWVEENRIVRVTGPDPCASELEAFFAADDARRNIAELGLGCNDSAVASGNVLEDEKVLGMHWAAGRSDHIGGAVGVDSFDDPAHVVHHDVVYPMGGPIEVTRLVLHYEDGTREAIIRGSRYTLFEDLPQKQRPLLTARQGLLIWSLLVAGSWSLLAWDVERRAANGPSSSRARARFFWSLIVLVFGPVGLLAYFFGYRQPGRTTDPPRAMAAWRRAIGPTLYHAAGYVTALLLVIALFVFVLPERHPLVTLAISYGVPFVSGLLLFAPVAASQSGGYGAAVRRALVAEVILANLGFASSFTLLMFLLTWWFPVRLKLADPIFGAIMVLAAMAGALLVYPFNIRMSQRGLDAWSSQLALDQEGAPSDPVRRTLSWKNGWGMLILSLALLLGAIGLIAVGFAS